MESRLQENDNRAIARLTDEGISTTFYHLLRECPPKSISFFAMLNKLLAKDKNFDTNNIFDYMFCYFNTKVKRNEIQEESINYDDDV